MFAAVVGICLFWLAARVDYAHAASVRNPSVVPDGSRYYRDATTGTTGTAVTFPAQPASVSIYNEDGTNALLVRFLRVGDAVTAAELAAPSDSTWTEVQSIPAGSTLVFDVRNSPGFIWDRAAGTGAFTVRLID